NPEEARILTEKVRPDEAADTLSSWMLWLSNHQDSARRTAVMGWCFGGGWALKAATLSPAEAAVVYYGRVTLPATELARLKGPVLGHFATRDTFITRDMVAGFEQAMNQAGKPYQVYWYEADHAFANPTGNTFDRDDAQLAWRRSLDFLKAQLGGAALGNNQNRG
ncbi:MAG: dienelactone hydrolase family protein, partial [Rhodospirillales bacterium]|nr:dienelactone hydrolase family protein [Rhodospirillales bacterium]